MVEDGHAAVVLREGAHFDSTGLRDFSRQHLAAYKVPKRILILDALPLLPVGKVDKMALRKRAAAEIDPLNV